MIGRICKQYQDWRHSSRKKKLYRQICSVLAGMEECVEIVSQYRNYPVTIDPQDAERAMRALQTAVEAIDSCLVLLNKEEKEQIQAKLTLLLSIMR